MSARTELPESASARARHRMTQSRSTGPVAESIGAAPFERDGAAAAALLGGPKVLQVASLEMLDLHHAIVRGLRPATLVHLKKSLVHLSTADLGRALGVSERTILRHLEQSSGRLGVALGSRVWRLAQLLAHATTVFGGDEQAQRWLISSAMGLDGWRPIDLLQTDVGEELVNEFLGRLQYGVYS